MKDPNDFMLVESEGDQLRKMTAQRDMLAEALREIIAIPATKHTPQVRIAKEALHSCGLRKS